MLITYDPQHPLRGVNQSISLEFLLHGYKECQQLFFFTNNNFAGESYICLLVPF